MVELAEKTIEELEKLTKFLHSDGDLLENDTPLKMCLSIFAQYLGDILYNHAMAANLIKQDLLSKTEMQRITELRNKIMHETTLSEFTESDLKNIINSHILPWKEDLYYLLIVLYERTGCRERILNYVSSSYYKRISPKLEKYNGEIVDTNKTILINSVLITAHIRLRNYSDARNIFEQTRSMMYQENFLSDTGFFIGIEIQADYLCDLVLRGISKEATEVDLAILKLTNGKKELENIEKEVRINLLSVAPEMLYQFDFNGAKEFTTCSAVALACLRIGHEDQTFKILKMIRENSEISSYSKCDYYDFNWDCAAYYGIAGERVLSNLLKTKLDCVERRELEKKVMVCYKMEREHLSIAKDHFEVNINYFKEKRGSNCNKEGFFLIKEYSDNLCRDIFFRLDILGQRICVRDLEKVLNFTQTAIKTHSRYFDSDWQEHLAALYINSGKIKLLMGIGNEKVKENFLQALEIYQNRLDSWENLFLVEYISDLGQGFRKIKDKKHFLICKGLLKRALKAKSSYDESMKKVLV